MIKNDYLVRLINGKGKQLQVDQFIRVKLTVTLAEFFW